MKKVFMLATAAVMFAGVAFAGEGDKKCAKGKECCKKEKSCHKEAKKEEKKPATKA
jgi:L-arabinose isomerase